MPGLDVEHEQRLGAPRRGQVAADDAGGLARAVEAVHAGIAVGDVGQQLEGEQHGAGLLGVRLGLLGQAAHGLVGRADAQRAELVALGRAIEGHDAEAGEDLAPAERELGRLGRRSLLAGGGLRGRFGAVAPASVACADGGTDERGGRGHDAQRGQAASANDIG